MAMRYTNPRLLYFTSATAGGVLFFLTCVSGSDLSPLPSWRLSAQVGPSVFLSVSKTNQPISLKIGV